MGRKSPSRDRHLWKVDAGPSCHERLGLLPLGLKSKSIQEVSLQLDHIKTRPKGFPNAML